MPMCAIARRLNGDPNILQHRQVGKQVGELERTTESGAGAGGCRKAGEIFSIQRHRSTARFELAGDQIEIGGFAGTIGADDGGQRARLKSATHAIDRDVPAEAYRQVMGCQQGHFAARSIIQRAGDDTDGNFAGVWSPDRCASIAMIAFICGADFFA